MQKKGLYDPFQLGRGPDAEASALTPSEKSYSRYFVYKITPGSYGPDQAEALFAYDARLSLQTAATMLRTPPDATLFCSAHVLLILIINTLRFRQSLQEPFMSGTSDVACNSDMSNRGYPDLEMRFSSRWWDHAVQPLSVLTGYHHSSPVLGYGYPAYLG
eukprot:6468801-Amphidinium_carterae.1